MKSPISVLLLWLLMSVSFSGYAQFQWVKTAGSNGRHEYLRAIALDSQGNVYAAGQHNDTTTFDGITLPTWGNPQHAPGSYLVKYSATGQLIWANGFRARAGNVASQCDVMAMTTDANGIATVFGQFRDSLTIGGQTIVNPRNSFGQNGLFGAQFDASGNLVWLKVYATVKSQPAKASSLANGDLLLAGYFTESIDFGGGMSFAVNPNIDRVGFVARFDAAGNCLWATKTNGKEEDRLAAMTADNNRVYIAGAFRDSIRFDAATAMGVVSPESNAGNRRNLFVAAYDLANGSFVWAQQVKGQLDWATDVAATANTLVLIGNAGGYVKIGNDSAIGTPFVAGLNLTNGQPLWLTKSSKFINKLKTIGTNQFYVFGNAGAGAWGIDTITTDHIPSGFYMAKFNDAGSALTAEGYGSSGATIGVGATDYQNGKLMIGGNLYGFGTVDLGGGLMLPVGEVSYNNLWLASYGPGGGGTAVHEIINPLEALVVYPNPATAGFAVNMATDKPLKYALYTLQGVLAGTGAADNQTFISTAGLATGTYVIRFSDQQYSITRRLVILPE